MRSSAAIAVLLLCFPQIQGATLKGRFVLNDFDTGQPVGGVAVTADGANPTASRSPFGDFTLKFPEKKPGDRVKLIISTKPGMVVVNWFELDVNLPSDAGSDIKIFVLARDQDREEMLRRYLHLRGHASLEAEKDQHLLEVKKLRASLAASDLAKLKPGETSPIDENTMRLIAEGQVDRAVGRLVPADFILAVRRSLEAEPLHLSTEENAGVIVGASDRRRSRLFVGFFEFVHIRVALYRDSTNAMNAVTEVELLLNRQPTSALEDWHLASSQQHQELVKVVTSALKKGWSELCTDRRQVEQANGTMSFSCKLNDSLTR